MSGVPELSVLVPVTERPWPLVDVFQENAKALRDAGRSFEFLFVVESHRLHLSDGLEELAASGEPVRLLVVGPHIGESAMLKAALPRARADLLLTLAPYPRVEPQGLPLLLQAVDEGADMATACRVSDHSSRINLLQRSLFHLLVRRGLGGGFQDLASGVRAMRREVLEAAPIYGDLSRFTPVLVQREGFDVREVPLPQHPEDARARVYPPGVYVRRLIDLLGVYFLLRFTRKPLRFFGLVGAVFGTAGFAILLVLGMQRLGGVAMSDRPLLLLGLLLAVLGAQAIALGLIGEIIVNLNIGRGQEGYRVREVVGGESNRTNPGNLRSQLHVPEGPASRAPGAGEGW